MTKGRGVGGEEGDLPLPSHFFLDLLHRLPATQATQATHENVATKKHKCNHEQ